MAWHDAIAKIKLPSGTVGKICFMGVAAAIALAAMVMAVRQPGVAYLAMILLTVIVLVLGLAVIWFANKHPQAALMEGGEFLKHELQIQKSKFTPSRIIETEDKSDKGPVILSDEQKLLLSEPEIPDNG